MFIPDRPRWIGLLTFLVKFSAHAFLIRVCYCRDAMFSFAVLFYSFFFLRSSQRCLPIYVKSHIVLQPQRQDGVRRVSEKPIGLTYCVFPSGPFWSFCSSAILASVVFDETLDWVWCSSRMLSGLIVRLPSNPFSSPRSCAIVDRHLDDLPVRLF